MGPEIGVIFSHFTPVILHQAREAVLKLSLYHVDHLSFFICVLTFNILLLIVLRSIDS